MTKHRPRIYLSGPISKGNRNFNFHQAVEAQRALMQLGFAVLNPMTSMLLPFAWQEEFPHDMWLECDLPWVEVADAVYRLRGESVGADRECDHAHACGVPVFHLESALVDFFKGPAVSDRAV